MRTFGDNLKEIQQTYGITAEFIARKAGYKKGTGSRYMTTDIVPKISTIIRFIEATPVPWTWSMYGYEIKKEK